MRLLVFTVGALSCLPIVSGAAEPRQNFENWYEDWSLDAVDDAQLVLVVKVTHVGKVKVVEGAKTDQSFREFRFQPIQQIKGIYSRGELVMSATDLGCTSSTGSEASDIREGQLRILMLSQSNPLTSGFGGRAFLGCVSAPNSRNFRQSVPLLSGSNDPIIAMFESVCRLGNERSRKVRAEIIAEALQVSDGPAVVPLLKRLRRDAVWAAARPDIVQPLLRLSRDERQPIREEAIRTIAAVLAWADNTSLPTEDLGQVLREFLNEQGQRTAVRVLSIRALSKLDKANDWRTSTLVEVLRKARTYEERITAADVLGQIGDESAFAELATEFRQLPLDCAAKTENTLANALLTIDPKNGARLLMDRFNESLATGQSVKGEVHLIAQFQIRDSIDELCEAVRSARQVTQIEIIDALGQLKAEEAVPELETLLSSTPNVSTNATSALLEIGSANASIALRPRLKTERDLRTKLRIAALLAAKVIGALGSARAEKRLVPMLNEKVGPQWYSAALAGLLAVKNEDAIATLPSILADDRHPIIVKAAEFAQLADRDAVLPQLTKLIESRNQTLALAALRAHAKLMQQDPNNDRASSASETKPVSVNLNQEDNLQDVLQTLRRVLADSYMDWRVREQALALLEQFPAKQSADTLLAMLDRTDTNDARILPRVESLIHERKIQIP